MLREVRVKNLALIDEAEVGFGSGLNILTGETGAGKSILIGSINFALGQKASQDMIRCGADYALVELIFETKREAVLQKIEALGIEANEGQIVISRKIKGGRSINRLNGETTTRSVIREVSSLLLDVHGQHAHQSLLYPEHQLEILDAYGKETLEEKKREVAALFSAYRQAEKAVASFEISEADRERELSFLQFEIEEIENAALEDGEEEALEARYHLMANSKRIGEALSETVYLTGDTEGAAAQVGRALRELSGVSSFDPQLAQMEEALLEVEALLSDFNRGTMVYMDGFSFSEQEFAEVSGRLDLIRRMEGKYGKTIPDVLAAYEEKQKRLEVLLHIEEKKKKAQEELETLEKELSAASEALSEERKKYAHQLSVGIQEGLIELNFLQVKFEIRFERTKSYHANGFDAVEFLISTNPGEESRPLEKVVSGGELSRIMLAIKTLLADKDETETLIFDEIDTGISGRTAQKVSEKMVRIGKSHQVICITHLAQIAAMADQHYRIEKKAEDNKTISTVYALSEKEKEAELARILGGAEITQAVLENAGEMRRLAEEWKKRI